MQVLTVNDKMYNIINNDNNIFSHDTKFNQAIVRIIRFSSKMWVRRVQLLGRTEQPGSTATTNLHGQDLIAVQSSQCGQPRQSLKTTNSTQWHNTTCIMLKYEMSHKK